MNDMEFKWDISKGSWNIEAEFLLRERMGMLGGVSVLKE